MENIRNIRKKLIVINDKTVSGMNKNKLICASVCAFQEVR